MFFLTPGYLKEGRQYVKNARKLVAYKRDLVSPETVGEVEREIAELQHALVRRERPAVESAMQRLSEVCGKLTPPVEDADWRENVEVILVAIVIALAVRTYFLQPFAIPTGSMQPTLNGILATPTSVPPPNLVSRLIQKAILGRTYFDVVAEADETLLQREEVKRFFFFTYTQLHTSAGNTYSIHAPQDVITKSFGLPVGSAFKRGNPIVRGYSDTGDHVFVDKLTYHFVRPQRDQVFVFSTRGIPRLNPPRADGTLPPSQYYIKRLAGAPGDQLRIASPELYINGKLATEPGFRRVMTGRIDQPKAGYRGYGNGAESLGRVTPMEYLGAPDEAFNVPPEKYFALGDNSYNSYDSRGWGTVPQENIAGRALLVYYPISQHFGWIW